MCPPPSVSLLIDINVHSSDEEVILYLDRRRVWDPIPSNVITEVNPFSVDPRGSPEGFWFLYSSDDLYSQTQGSIIKVTNGYWKFMDDFRILTSTATVGRKTTSDFYVGQAPFGEKSHWRMLQYQAVSQGSNKSQDISTLSRFFLQDDDTSNTGDQCELVRYGDANGENIESMLLGILEQDERNSSSGDAAKVDGEDAQTHQELVNNNSIMGGQALYDFSKEDFLELKDFYDLESSSSGSDNSSLISMNSDECFDAEALLRDIENDGMNQEENVNYRLSVTASVRSDPAVISPPHLLVPALDRNTNLDFRENGSAYSSPTSDSASSSSTLELHSDTNVSMSGSSHGSYASTTYSGSSRGSSNSRGSGSKSFRRMAKLGKRYCCFRSF